MGQEIVDQVFGPVHVRDALTFYRERCHEGERLILRYRRLLREADAGYPEDPFDREAWEIFDREVDDEE